MAALVVLVSSCGTSGGAASGSRTLSGLSSPTASLSASRSSRTAEAPTTEQAQSAAPPQTSVRTQVVTRTKTTAPSAQPTAHSSAVAPAGAQPTQAASDDSDSSPPAWVWWLLGAILLAVVVGTVLLVRRRNRHRAWARRFTAAEGEVAWFARDAIPRVAQAPTAGQMAGGWRIEATRVTALEDTLTTLEATAVDDRDRMKAATLRDAVRTSSLRLADLESSPNPPAAMGLLGFAAAGLEAALAAVDGRTQPPQAAPAPP